MQHFGHLEPVQVMVGKLETQFDRYRKRGDVAALADVFDRTAPEVLRVARHLAPAGVEPEELVQETFLTAIRAADTYDRSRRLVPWLLGILGNQARNMRRKVRRTPDSATPGGLALEPGEAIEDPDVADPTLEEAVTSAVGDLPDPYRAVLVLHLAHGLRSAAIAESLDRPRTTVRSQLRRGLKLLKKSLPPSMALGAMPAGGLAAMRAKVVAEGSTAAGAASAGVAAAGATLSGLTTGGLLMTKPALALGVVLLSTALLGGGVFFASWNTAEEESPVVAQVEERQRPGTPSVSPGAPVLRGATGADANAAPDAPSGVGPATAHAGSRRPTGTVVEGRVLVQGTQGTLADAKVLLFPTTKGRVLGEAIVTTADGKGHYRFEGVAAGLYQIVPALAGYYLPPPTSGPARHMVSFATGIGSYVLPREFSLVVSKAETRMSVDLSLLRGYAVQGHVRDPKGNAVAGVRLLATGSPFGHALIGRALHGKAGVALAVSDEAGSFQIEGLPPRVAWALGATKRGWPDARSPRFALGPQDPTASVEIVLVPGATVRGRVVDEDGGGGKGPITVFCRQGPTPPSQPPQASMAVRVQPDGTFELVGVRAGTVSLQATRSGRSSPPLSVRSLEPEEVRDGLELRIPAVERITGTVVDEAGKPVSGLVLRAEFAGMPQGHSTTTDEEGRFEFHGVPAGRTQLFARSGSSMVHLGPLAEDARTGLRFVVRREPSVTLRGTVLDTDGKAVPMAHVQVIASSSGKPVASHMALPMRAYDVVDGQFEVEVRGFPPYTVLVSAARDARGQSLNLREGRVAVRDATQRVTLRLEAGLVVAGSVMTAAGEPLVGVKVRANFAQTQTDERGRFRFEGLAAGQVRVELAWVPGYGRIEKQIVEVGRLDVAFVLTKASKIAGRVLDPQGTPIAESWVAVTWPASERGRAGKLTIATGADGRFEIDGIPAGGPLRVEAAWPVGGGAVAGHAFAPAVHEGVRRGTLDVELRFGSGLEISGVVLDAEGKPATACKVFLMATDARSSPIGGMPVAADGAWSITGLEAKKYNVIVMLPNRAAAPETRIVEAPAANIRLQLRPTLPLSGVLKGLVPQGLRPWTVDAWREDGSTVARAAVMPGGTFHFVGLPKGESVYLGAVGHEDDRFAQLGPVTAGDKNLVLTVRAGHALSVELVVPEGLPVTRFYVEVKRPGWRAKGRKQLDGRYLIRALPPGTYTVHARAFGPAGRAPLHEVEKIDVDADAGTIQLVFPAR